MAYPVAATRNKNFGGGPFSPAVISGLALWVEADSGLTLYTTGYAGSGTVTQVGTAITGVSTQFLKEVVIGDTLTGTLISGTVTAIADATHLTVDASNSGAGAAYTITPVAGASDRVTTWADQSGNNKNPTQATAKTKPSKKLAAQNSLPAVRFDGWTSALSVAYSRAGPRTMYFAFTTLKLNGASGRTFFDSAGTGEYSFQDSDGITSSVSADGIGSITFNTISINTPTLLAVGFNGASSWVSLNGGARTTGDTGTAPTSTAFTLGHTTGSDQMDVFVALDYAGDHTLTQQGLLQTYINNKWALY